jgi:phage portal protein BeeE
VGLLERIADQRQNGSSERAQTISIFDWAKMFAPGQHVTYQGQTYQAFQTMQGGESPGAAWYDSNSVVFACTQKRVLLFSEARFAFQRLRDGRPGELFGTQDLEVIERPWIGATTRDLLARAELDVTFSGNSYWVPDGDGLLRLDPTRVKVLTERATDEVLTGNRTGERLLAYAYVGDDDEITIYEPAEIAHYKPHPDRVNPWIGMSWLNPCLPDVDADQQMTEHKRAHLRNGARVPFVVSYDAGVTVDQFNEFVRIYKEEHAGPENSGKVLHLGGGADAKTIGQTFEELSFKATQGHVETRIAACSGIAPVLVGLSEGLSHATYNNYGLARRATADGTMRPLWGAFSAAFESVVPTPQDARLWYDTRDIAWLREDVKDLAEIFGKDASACRVLADGGWQPDAVIEAVAAKDIGRLAGRHSELFSVQLQPPGSGSLDELEPATNNGN